jgi:GntR family transcriptional regulator
VVALRVQGRVFFWFELHEVIVGGEGEARSDDFIDLDAADRVPLYRQIVDAVWERVVSGDLETGRRLPTVRQYAIDLGVHPNTVVRAYQELELLGVVERRGGNGTVVSIGEADKERLDRGMRLEQICQDAVERARTLGFSIDDVLDTLTELRRSRTPRSQ